MVRAAGAAGHVSERTCVMGMELGTSMGTRFQEGVVWLRSQPEAGLLGPTAVLKKDGDWKIQIRGQEGSQSMGCGWHF